MFQKTKIVFLCCLLLGIVGCASTENAPPKPNEFSDNLLKRIKSHHLPVNQDAASILAESAVSVSQSLTHLAEVRRAVYPHAKLPPLPDPIHIGMAEKASIDWAGPIEPLIRKIAKATRYKVRVIGKRPAIPIVVSITTREETPLADILRDLSFQADKQATIVLYPRQRLMELRYMNR